MPKAQSMKAEIVSFLNSNTGGMIYLGTDDNGELVQFSSENEKQKNIKNGKRHLIIG